MKGEVLQEFIRRLNAEGYRSALDNNGAGTIYVGRGKCVYTYYDGDSLYISYGERLSQKVQDILDEVNEYMTAFLNATPGVQCGPDGNGESVIRTLLSYDSHELTGIRLPNGDMEFDVISDCGGLVVSHSHVEYGGAKHEFAIRAGLIDKNLLFTRTHLNAIRSVLSDYLTMENRSHPELDHAVKSVIGQIDDALPARERSPETGPDAGMRMT